MSKTAPQDALSYIKSGDLFKLMSIRYPDSICNSDGSFNIHNPASISLELIQWFNQCEFFYNALFNHSQTLDSSEAIEIFTKQELNKLQVIDPRVFPDSRFNTLSDYQSSKLGLNFKLIALNISSEKVALSQLVEGYIGLVQSDKVALQDKFNKLSTQYHLSDEDQDAYNDLLKYINGTSHCYVFCFDIIFEQMLSTLEAYKDWDHQLICYTYIVNKILERFFNLRNDYEQYFFKAEVHNRFDHRFHVVVILDRLQKSEKDWLENLEIFLKETFENIQLIEGWINALKATVNEHLKKSFADRKDYLPEAYSGMMELNLWEPNFINHCDQIKFKIVNWNDTLRDHGFISDFEVSKKSTVSDRSQIEYWVLKYIFWSRHFIFFENLNKFIFDVNQIWSAKQPVPKQFRPSPILVGKVPTVEKTNSKLKNKNSLPSYSKVTAAPTAPTAPAPHGRRQDSTAIKTPLLGNLTIAGIKNKKATDKPKFPQKETLSVSPIVIKPDEKNLDQLNNSITLDSFIELAKGDKHIWEINLGAFDAKRIELAEVFYKELFYPEGKLAEFITRLEIFLLTLKEEKDVKIFHLDGSKFDSSQGVDPKNLLSLGKQYLVLYDFFHRENVQSSIVFHKLGFAYSEFIYNIFTLGIGSPININGVGVNNVLAHEFNQQMVEIKKSTMN